MGVPTVMYSPSHPRGRVFDSDDVASLGSDWVDHPDKVADEADFLDLWASDDELAQWSKRSLEDAAREQLGIELDRRKGIRKLIADIRAAQG